MLEVNGIDVGYGETQVLYDVSLSVDEGEFVAIIGPNGAGKTTLFRAISGSLTPWDGDVVYQGDSIAGVAPHDIARKGVAHVPQEHNIFTDMSVIDNLRVGNYSPSVRDKRQEQLDLVFDIFPRLDERRSQIAGTLSGGERKMLAVAKGLMSDPDLIMLDEPSAGLAPNLVEEIFARIQTIREETGVTVLLVEQRVLESLEVAQRGYVIENGRIELSGPTEELRRESKIQESYLGM
jgi:branched-chain amino acid transport system ATP-binding protein